MLVAVFERLPWSSRRPLSPGTRAGVGAAVILLFFLGLLEYFDGVEPHYIGLMATAPFLAAAFAPWRPVLVAGGLATALGAGFAVMSGAPGSATVLNVVGIALAS